MPITPDWIDTHCHLDAFEFDTDRDQVVAAAAAHGIRHIIIPAVGAANFSRVAQLAAAVPGAAYALGIHPLYTPQAAEADIDVLRERVKQAMSGPQADVRLVAIGEIGLDFFVPMLTTPQARARQEWFYTEQLRIAKEFGLPVLLHVRRSQDALLKQLRRIEVHGGIAHAFNGSHQQAQHFISLGFRLGFGGAMTFERALQIRRLAAEMPTHTLVLETDAPDIAPAWLTAPGMRARNTPAELARIAQTLMQLRGWTLAETAAQTNANAYAALPRLCTLAGDRAATAVTTASTASVSSGR